MKIIRCLMLLLLVAAGSQTFAQHPSCCTPAAGGQAALYASADFQAAHLPPLPLNYAPKKGTIINFNTLDGKTGRAFYVPSSSAATEVLLIFHEWWGLNDYMMREAERLQDSLGDKVDVYAVDLFDGKVATTPEEAGKLSGGVDPKRADDVIRGVLSQVGPDKRVSTLGWCFGGGWALRASVLAGKQGGACVMYYGFPEQDSRKLAGLSADVQYHYATQDNFIKPSDVSQLETNVKSVGRSFERYDYNAAHAFANPSNPKYDHAAARTAEGRTMVFLRKKMQIE